MRRIAAPLLLALSALPAAAEVPQGPPQAGFAPAFDGQTRAPALPGTPVRLEPLATGLEHPWGIAPLPDGAFLVTERPGRLRIIAPDGRLGPPLAGVPAVSAERQGGLLDVALAADFARSGAIHLTYAKPVQGGAATALARAVLDRAGGRLIDLADLWVQTPAVASGQHFGSRVVVAGDLLYLTTGDRGRHRDPALVQDPSSGLGKVVRLTAEGRPAPGNPRADVPWLWSLGHRNVQGAALDAEGRLWTVEHGPRGGDELNRPEAGANHGWPITSHGIDYAGGAIGAGIPRAEGMAEPVYYWDPVIAPGGMAFYDGPFAEWRGDLLIGSLNPGGLVRLRIEGDRVTGEERLVPEAGRVRDVEVLADGSILLLVDAARGGILRLTPR